MRICLIFMWLSLGLSAQTTAIPDPYFEQWLIDNGIDSDQQLNGHILTSDALSVTQLTMDWWSTTNQIQDLTGLEAFVNLTDLTVSNTWITQLPLTTLTHLKSLTTKNCQLTALDLSQAIALEHITIFNEFDIYPQNMIESLDVSHNAQLKTLVADGLTCLNLNNNANALLTQLDIGCMYCNMTPNATPTTIQIKVDQPIAAQNNQYPYNNWQINSYFRMVEYTSDLSNCGLSIPVYQIPRAEVYPNPVRDGVLHVDSSNDAILQFTLYDLQGRVVRHGQPTTGTLVMSDLATGTYLLQWQTRLGRQTRRVVVE